MNPLKQGIAATISHDGPMTLEHYMTLCLSDPRHGYYMTRDPFGPRGDFVTAPEISQIFGELIGLWCVVVWQQMGSPATLDLVELGPGRGTLIRDALRAARVMPGFLAAARVTLIETSPVLEAEQRRTLAGSHAPINWLADSAALGSPEHSQRALIVVANEILDCEPRDQVVRAADGWRQRTVALDAQGDLVFATGDLTDMERLPAAQREDLGSDAPEGTVFEATPDPWSRPLIAGRETSAALFLDYGHEATALGDTLQAVRDHRPEHPLTSPGEADLTMQVDFAATRLLFRMSARLEVDGPLTQAEFLGSLGIVERASRLMAANPDKAAAIETAVARLMAPNGMGTRFKALGVRSPSLPPLPGFPLAPPPR